MDTEENSIDVQAIVDNALKILDKVTAASPTLLFDFLIMDIRQWNLTGHHLIQDERQKAAEAIANLQAAQAAKDQQLHAAQEALVQAWVKSNPPPPVWNIMAFIAWGNALAAQIQRIKALP